MQGVRRTKLPLSFSACEMFLVRCRLMALAISSRRQTSTLRAVSAQRVNVSSTTFVSFMLRSCSIRSTRVVTCHTMQRNSQNIITRCVQNLTNVSDISFLKTKLTSKFKNWKLSFHSSVFKNLTSTVWGQFFTLSHSQFIFQHDRINSLRLKVFFLHALSLHF